jgi:Bacterial Ig-like domain/WD40-like Beta Propeller Repeat
VRLVVFRSLIVLAVGALALLGVLYVASTVDARAPEVLGFELTQPLPDDRETALITTSLEVAFNEPVRVDAGTDPLALEPAVEGSVSWSGSTMIFTPRDRLALETEYVATVGTGIRDMAGNRIATPPPTFTFSTSGRPAVAQTLPEDGARDVAVEDTLRITFTTLMDTGSVERELSIEPAIRHELQWSGEVLEIVPADVLEPGRTYVIRIGADAADVAGVALGQSASITFQTVAAGLEPVAVLPADGVDGIAPTTPIAILFDRSIDPDSASADLVAIRPDVAGSVDVVPADPGGSGGTLLRFTPSGPLPLNTTFEVSVAPGLRAADGGLMAEPLTWSFTTGAPAAALSNQITFISDRAGVANVWAMNPDGSGQHQVSTELTPVLDYAVSPDGSRLVVADGRRLVVMRGDGSGRSVITDDGHLEFDPAYAPDGQRLAFGRADAATDEGLGLWIASADGEGATQVEFPPEIGAEPTPSASGEDSGAGTLRAPRFSPDGQALAFVDVGNQHLGVLELPSDRVTRVDATVTSPPEWVADSSAVLVTHRPRPDGQQLVRADGLVHPLEPNPPDEMAIGQLSRSGLSLVPTDLGRGPGATLLAIDRDGRVAYLIGGRLHVAGGVDESGELVRATADEIVRGAAFGRGEAVMVIALAGRVELLDLVTGRRTVLVPEGSRPNWLP